MTKVEETELLLDALDAQLLTWINQEVVNCLEKVIDYPRGRRLPAMLKRTGTVVYVVLQGPSEP